eukprot:TRINITY_DN7655_c0_g1_i1.p1 TRINITY_DN7655_c0_g1~~TRINITY_DN7655_c0_g1_i1.p1  ORF type:complete len:200 (-),score=23.47 TRINITY_DN7655_c0_g1_i1:87-686(-)
MSRAPDNRTFSTNIACGGAAGACSLILTYPLDFAKMLFVNGNKTAKKAGGERQFNGLVDVYRRTVASDGIRGFYRGFNISCLGIVVYRGLYFGLYDSLEPRLLTGTLKDSFTASFLLGWATTISAGFVSYPIDTVRRRTLIKHLYDQKYLNSYATFREIITKEGFAALYRGGSAIVLRSVAGAGVLACYDKLQRRNFLR